VGVKNYASSFKEVGNIALFDLISVQKILSSGSTTCISSFVLKCLLSWLWLCSSICSVHLSRIRSFHLFRLGIDSKVWVP